jgi:xanthine dehydrogenase accessory factor
MIVDTVTDILDAVSSRKAADVPFALATVVRTVAATAAKAGAKAVILTDGTISEGWIGGGCARAAVLKAAREALADGQPRLISVQPPGSLEDRGVAAGDRRDGVSFAANMCPSQGTMDIFIEPIMPLPQIAIFGSSPVAIAIASLARRLGFATAVCAPKAEQANFVEADQRFDGFDLLESERPRRFIVVSTQGRGDEAALKVALSVKSEYVAFVGSRRKAAALTAKLAAAGVPAAALAALKAPAGLDLGAITPEEIALSVLAEIVAARRARRSNQAVALAD